MEVDGQRGGAGSPVVLSVPVPGYKLLCGVPRTFGNVTPWIEIQLGARFNKRVIKSKAHSVTDSCVFINK